VVGGKVRAPAPKRQGYLSRKVPAEVLQPEVRLDVVEQPQEEEGPDTEDNVDGGAADGRDEVGARRMGNIHGRQAPEGPHQHLLGVAVDRSCSEAMTELVQQHGQKDDQREQGGIHPRPRGQILFARRPQDQPHCHQREEDVNPDRDAEQAAERDRPGKGVLHCRHSPVAMEADHTPDGLILSSPRDVRNRLDTPRRGRRTEFIPFCRRTE